MGRFIIVVMFTLFCSDAFAQSACYDLTRCTKNGAVVRAEVVPQTQLAKCEDYKAKAQAVKGLIRSNQNALASASACKGALGFFKESLSNQFLRFEKERKRREAAEKKAIWVGGIAFVGGVIVTIATIFVIQKID